MTDDEAIIAARIAAGDAQIIALVEANVSLAADKAHLTKERKLLYDAVQELLAEAVPARELIPTLQARIAVLEAQVSNSWGIESVQHVMRTDKGLIQTVITEKKHADHE